MPRKSPDAPERRPAALDFGTVQANTFDRRQEGPPVRWYWRARRRDTKETVWCGWATREEAAAAIAAVIAAGLPKRTASGAVRTVGDLLDAWCAHQARRQEAGVIAPRSLDNYKRGAGYWKSAIADVLAPRLTRAMVEDTLTAWQADGVAPRTCKMGLDALAGAVKWGAPRGYCPAVDLARLEALRIRDDEHVNCSRTPTPGEVAAVLSAMPDDPITTAVRLLAWTGARVGEVAALTVADVDLPGRALVLSGRDDVARRRGKTGVRRFPLVGEMLSLAARLAEGRPPDARLVAGLAVHLSDQVNVRLEVACVEAKVPRFTCHGLRRMAAMRWLESGTDPKTVARLTGHSVATLLRSYVRPTEETLRSAVSRGALPSLTTMDPDNVVDLPRSQLPVTRRGDGQ